MEQNDRLTPKEGVLDLGKTGDDLTGFGDHGQGIDRAADQRLPGLVGQRRRYADVPPEAPAKLVTTRRIGNRGMRGGNPKASARKLA